MITLFMHNDRTVMQASDTGYDRVLTIATFWFQHFDIEVWGNDYTVSHQKNIVQAKFDESTKSKIFNIVFFGMLTGEGTLGLYQVYRG